MKKIMFITSSMSSGGAERVISILTKKFTEKNYQVIVLSTFTENNLKDFYELPRSVIRVKLADYIKIKKIFILNSIIKFFTFRKIIKDYKPDIIISFTSYINILSLVCLIGFKIPIVVSERVNPFKHNINFFLTIIRPIAYKFAKNVVCQTSNLTLQVKKAWGLKNVVTIENPLSEKIPKINKWNKRENIVLSIGRLDKQKGHDMLIKAWSMLDNKKGWKLLIIGSGAEKKNLISIVKSLNLTREVEIKDTVKNIWKEYNKSKIFILPSRYEGYPNVLIEAMAMGNAVIATDCKSGPREIIKKNGILTDIKIESIYKGLKLLLFDKKKQIKFSNKYLSVRKKFDSEFVYRKWNKIITDITEK